MVKLVQLGLRLQWENVYVLRLSVENTDKKINKMKPCAGSLRR
jgi:hypothetical protein